MEPYPLRVARRRARTRGAPGARRHGRRADATKSAGEEDVVHSPRNSRFVGAFRRCAVTSAPLRHADAWTDARPGRVQATASCVHVAFTSYSREHDEVRRDVAMQPLATAPRRSRQLSTRRAVRHAPKDRERERRRFAAAWRPWRPSHPLASNVLSSHALLLHPCMRRKAETTRTRRCDDLALVTFAREDTLNVEACALARARFAAPCWRWRRCARRTRWVRRRT